MARIMGIFYWPEMKRSVIDYVSRCTVCQSVKPIYRASQGLLQPLPIPGKIWHSIAMDFITNLPPSEGKTTIMVVIDRLSKHSHFSALGVKFTAPQVAEVMVRDVIKIHGPPAQIISDRDPIFMSCFWRELFKIQGTMLATSSAYHPQTDGQTEVLNKYLEDYLRCFAADHPRQWVRFLPWAEWHYNSAWHSAIRMTPYEAVFGRTPPTLQDYLRGNSTVAAVDEVLTERAELLSTLQANLKRAQARMANQVNTKRTDIQFQQGEWVWLRLQPYRQVTLARRSSHKLARRFYGPFQIMERIGKVAYRLQLPSTAKLHNVFHVSKLKRFVGDPVAAHRLLPTEFLNQHPLQEPAAILKRREILKLGRNFKEVLVQWKGQLVDDATWEDEEDFITTFPDFILEDKDVFQEEAIVARELKKKTSSQHQQDNTNTRRSTKKNRGRNDKNFGDFIMGQITLNS